MLPVRLGAVFIAAMTLSMSVLVGAPAPAMAAAPKVAIIVGPVGSLTSTYRSYANEVAIGATAAGAMVVKAYSPNATWANVKNAVNGANVMAAMNTAPRRTGNNGSSRMGR